MNAASNALGLIAAAIWFLCGLFVLWPTRSCELSLRALLGVGLVLAAGLVSEVVRVGFVDWLSGIALVILSLLTAAIVATRHGRRAVGLDGLGLTEPADLSGHGEGESNG